MYKIKSPIMKNELPELLDLTFAGKTQDLIGIVIERFTTDENGNAVDGKTLPVKDYMKLVPLAMRELGFGADEGNA